MQYRELSAGLTYIKGRNAVYAFLSYSHLFKKALLHLLPHVKINIYFEWKNVKIFFQIINICFGRVKKIIFKLSTII